MQDYELLQKMTKSSSLHNRTLVNWFNRQNIEIQKTIFDEQKNQYFKIKASHDKCIKSLIALAAFYLAIDEHYKIIQANGKNKSLNINNIKKSSEVLITQAKKQSYSAKKERLLNLWSKIQELKSANFSYREISNYLLSKHRFLVSHAYIQKIWKELENE